MAGERKVRMFVVLGPGEPRPGLAELAELGLLAQLLAGVSRAPGEDAKVAEPGYWACADGGPCPLNGACGNSRFVRA